MRACLICGTLFDVDSLARAQKRRLYCETHIHDKAAKARYYFSQNPGYHLQVRREYNRKKKLDVLDKYGGECECCGEKEPDFLTIEHKKGNGRNDRKEKTRGIYMILLESPLDLETYGVLCWNCNSAKGLFETCPHQRIEK